MYSNHFSNALRMGEFRMTVQVNFRMDKEVKAKMEEIVESLGMTATVAYTLFAHAVIREKGIPFDLKLEDSESSEKNEINLDDTIKE